jgi:hypothetical protein
MTVWAVIRPTRSHTEWKGLYETEADAQAKVDFLNAIYPRGARYGTLHVVVRPDSTRETQ